MKEIIWLVFILYELLLKVPNKINLSLKGGQIIGNGSPEDIANIKKSFTGKFLKQIL